MNHLIPEQIINDIRSRADIVEVISETVTLKKTGKNLVGLCPFHSEKTPSFSVSPDKQIYFCFGCSSGGNVFKFLMESEKLSFVEAVKTLAEKFGVAIPGSNQSPVSQQAASEREKLLSLNKLAVEYFRSLLIESEGGKAAKDYIVGKRGLREETMTRFQLGWSSPDWKDLLNYLQKKTECSVPQLVKAGLIVQKGEPPEKLNFFDRFRGRLMIPLHDTSGNVIGFAGRILFEGQPKYLNSPETPVYKKRDHLFGLNAAKEAIRKNDRVILVEGYFDQIQAFQNGICNIVATSGTAFTPQHAALLRNFTRNAVLVFDSDKAGQNAIDRAYEVLNDQGFKVFVLALPEGQDPDSYIQAQGSEVFSRGIQQAVPFMEYFIKKLIQQGSTESIQGKIEIINRVVPYLAKIENQIERSEFIRYLAEQANVESDSLLKEVKSAIKQKSSVAENRLEVSVSSDDPEFYLLNLLIAHSELAGTGDRVEPEEFKNPVLKDTYGLILKEISAQGSVSIDKLVDLTDAMEVRDTLTRIGLSPIGFDNPEFAFKDCIRRIRRRNGEQEINTLKQELLKAQKAGMAGRTRELHTKVRELQSSYNQS